MAAMEIIGRFFEQPRSATYAALLAADDGALASLTKHQE
jgi:hypothetical protein